MSTIALGRKESDIMERDIIEPKIIERDILLLLDTLFQKQQEIKYDHHLASHRLPTSMKRRLDIYLKLGGYFDSLNEGAKILDWGCMHAAESCMLKKQYSEKFEFYGCDFFEPNSYPAFHDYANLQYTQLNHTYNLPYEDNSFDLIFCSGVLEHAPNDRESLKEHYRVLKNDGLLIITFLPNHLSYTEFLARKLFKKGHARLYAKKQIREMLLHTGFKIEKLGYNQMLPAGAYSFSKAGRERMKPILELLWPMNSILEKIWPLNCLSSNIHVVARKVRSM